MGDHEAAQHRCFGWIDGKTSEYFAFGRQFGAKNTVFGIFTVQKQESETKFKNVFLKLEK